MVIHHIEYDPHYIYFCVGHKLFRINRKHMMRKATLKDKELRKRVKEYNRKLRERVYTIPEDIYKLNHIYVVKKDGSVVDAGMRYKNFTKKDNPNNNRPINFNRAKEEYSKQQV